MASLTPNAKTPAMKIYFRLILLVFAFLPVIAAGQSVYSGKVTDTQTHFPISGAEVSIIGSEAQTTTNNLGYFTLNTGSGTTPDTEDYQVEAVNGIILWNSKKLMDIWIANTLGQISGKMYRAQTGSGQINMTNFADGVYLLNITCNGVRKSHKLIKAGTSLLSETLSPKAISQNESLQQNAGQTSDTLVISRTGYYAQKYAFQKAGETYELLKLNNGNIDYMNRLIRPEAFTILQGAPLNPSYGEVKSVKVVYSISDNSIYYTNSEKYLIHFYFCRDVLGYNKGHAAFNQEQYTNNANRKYILASLNHFTSSGQYTLEFFAGDELDCSDIEKVYTKITQTAWIGNKLNFYANSTKWETCPNVPIITSGELYEGQNYQALNPESNYGYLKKIDTGELGQTYLGRHDIVLLNSIPIDISVVAGIITTEFQTPLSHINVLSHNRGTPNMALRDGWTNPRIDKLLNKLIYLEVSLDSFYIREATLQEAQLFWAKKEPQTIHQLKSDISTKGLIELTGADVNSVSIIGGKAANFAELKKINVANYGSLPMPEGDFAIPFSYYYNHIKKYGLDVFIDRMLNDPVFRTDAAWRDKQLKILRDSIKSSTLDPDLLHLVVQHLSTSGNYTDFRFRSSTNAEDIEGFNGAGLYESYTGSLTNLDKPVDKAIRKVWASLWSYEAFEERDYFKIDHQTIAMGVLVHRSFPAEAANGVVITENLYNRFNPAITVNVQFGEISVVNPEEKYLPDQLICYTYSSENIFEYLNHSNVPGMEGQTVMTDNELIQLKSFCVAIHNHYCMLNMVCQPMDIEFKVDVVNGKRKIYIKQARLY